MCTDLAMVHLDDFSDIVTYIYSVMIIFLGEKLGILGGGGELLPLKYPR